MWYFQRCHCYFHSLLLSLLHTAGREALYLDIGNDGQTFLFGSLIGTDSFFKLSPAASIEIATQLFLTLFLLQQLPRALSIHSSQCLYLCAFVLSKCIFLYCNRNTIENRNIVSLFSLLHSKTQLLLQFIGAMQSMTMEKIRYNPYLLSHGR